MWSSRSRLSPRRANHSTAPRATFPPPPAESTRAHCQSRQIPPQAQCQRSLQYEDFSRAAPPKTRRFRCLRFLSLKNCSPQRPVFPAPVVPRSAAPDLSRSGSKAAPRDPSRIQIAKSLRRHFRPKRNFRLSRRRPRFHAPNPEFPPPSWHTVFPRTESQLENESADIPQSHLGASEAPRARHHPEEDICVAHDPARCSDPTPLPLALTVPKASQIRASPISTSR